MTRTFRLLFGASEPPSSRPGRLGAVYEGQSGAVATSPAPGTAALTPTGLFNSRGVQGVGTPGRGRGHDPVGGVKFHLPLSAGDLKLVNYFWNCPFVIFQPQ